VLKPRRKQIEAISDDITDVVKSVGRGGTLMSIRAALELKPARSRLPIYGWCREAHGGGRSNRSPPDQKTSGSPIPTGRHQLISSSRSSADTSADRMVKDAAA
jgi:hypothetical protein